VSWLTEPDSEWDSDERPDEPRSRLRLIALLLAGWLVVSLLVLVILLAISGRHSANQAQGPSQSGSSSASDSASHPPAGSGTALALPDGWVREASDRQTNCAAHAYGQVQSYFTRNPCVSVERLLASTNQRGRAVVIASNLVTLRSAAQAQQYLNLVNADGTGNISDLLRDGFSYPGGPDKLPDAAFASRQDGNKVWVAEAGYVGGISSATDPTLRAIAQEAIR
jgi:hypothetical protein